MDNDSERHWRSRRLVDIGTVVALLIILMTGYWAMLPHFKPTRTSYIVPSQTVRW